MLESKIEAAAVRRALTELGVPSSKLGQQGDPDRIFWIPGGRPLLIEFKRPGEQPRPLQNIKIGRLRLLGYTTEVHDNVNSALAAIRRCMGATQLPDHSGEVAP